MLYATEGADRCSRCPGPAVTLDGPPVEGGAQAEAGRQQQAPGLDPLGGVDQFGAPVDLVYGVLQRQRAGYGGGDVGACQQ